MNSHGAFQRDVSVTLGGLFCFVAELTILVLFLKRVCFFALCGHTAPYTEPVARNNFSATRQCGRDDSRDVANAIAPSVALPRSENDDDILGRKKRMLPLSSAAGRPKTCLIGLFYLIRKASYLVTMLVRTSHTGTALLVAARRLVVSRTKRSESQISYSTSSSSSSSSSYESILSSITNDAFDIQEWTDDKIHTRTQEIQDYNHNTKSLVGALRHAPAEQQVTMFGPTFFPATKIARSLPRLGKNFTRGCTCGFDKTIVGTSSFACTILSLDSRNGNAGIRRVFRRPSTDTLKWGDIIGDIPKQPLFSYSASFPNARSVHANNPKPAVDLRPGSTHVALEFNDLGELLSANYCNGHNNDTSDVSPLHFVGYDRSPFSMAKYSVIAEMLQQPDTTPRHILQVWFSSTWTNDTLLSFRQACHAVLPLLKHKLATSTTGNPPKSTADEEARAKTVQYVSDWIRTVPILAELATKYWCLYSCAAGSADPLLEACNFVSRADRASLMRYFLTGHVLGSTPDTTNDSGTTPSTRADLVGNITMWGGSNHRRVKDDPILLGDRITTTELTESLLEETEQCSGSKDVMQCIIDRKMRQICKLKKTGLERSG
eukprot:scaffold4457_cov169-Amphora_coffeaeformis.AAC.6